MSWKSLNLNFFSFLYLSFGLHQLKSQPIWLFNCFFFFSEKLQVLFLCYIVLEAGLMKF